MNSMALAGNSEQANRLIDSSVRHSELPLDNAELAIALAYERFTLAAVLIRMLPEFQWAPVSSLFEVVENPGMDRRPAIELWDQWPEESGMDLNYLIYILAILGEFDRIDFATWTGGDIYTPAMAEFRRSPEFREHVRAEGIHATWKQLGFPRWCRAVGEDDFECD